MIKIPVNELQEALIRLNKDWQVISINSTGFIFLVVQVERDILLLYDILLLEVVGRIVTDITVYGYYVGGTAVFYYTEPLNLFSTVCNSKGIMYKLDEFVPEGEYKEWVKAYRKIVEDWRREKHEFNNLLQSHPMFNIRD